MITDKQQNADAKELVAYVFHMLGIITILTWFTRWLLF
jgi:hypothetical protein